MGCCFLRFMPWWRETSAPVGWRPGRRGRGGGVTEILDVPEVLARWAVERIDQVIDVQGLMGDAGDNVPGIPGVGEKTATALVQAWGSIENAIANADKIKGKLQEKVKLHAEQALLSKKPVTIMTADAYIQSTLPTNRNAVHSDLSLTFKNK